MSYSFANFIACPNIQEPLNDQFGQIMPTMVEKQTGLLDFTVSDLNESGFTQLISPGQGRRRSVAVRYQPRRLETSVTNEGARLDCSAGPVYGETTSLYSIDPDTEGWQHQWSADQADLEERCEEDATYFARQLMNGMSAMRRKIATDAVTQVQAQVGAIPGGTLSSAGWASGVLTTLPVEDLTYAFDLMQSPFRPWVFGLGNPSKYFAALDAGCCAVSNYDLGQYAANHPINFMKDDAVRVVMGETEYLATIPGAVQFLRYNQFEGDTRRIITANYRQDTVIDPVNGLMYDFRAKFDCGVWSFGLALAGKFVVMPDDVFFAQDPLSGVNYVVEGIITRS